jgi:hypothetical protein
MLSPPPPDSLTVAVTVPSETTNGVELTDSLIPEALQEDERDVSELGTLSANERFSSQLV